MLGISTRKSLNEPLKTNKPKASTSMESFPLTKEHLRTLSTALGRLTSASAMDLSVENLGVDYSGKYGVSQKPGAKNQDLYIVHKLTDQLQGQQDLDALETGTVDDRDHDDELNLTFTPSSQRSQSHTDDAPVFEYSVHATAHEDILDPTIQKGAEVSMVKKGPVNLDDVEVNWDYYAVFDGHGMVNLAAETAVENLSSEVVIAELEAGVDTSRARLPEDASIAKAFLKVEAEVIRRAREVKQGRTGTCAVCLFVHSPLVHLASNVKAGAEPENEKKVSEIEAYAQKVKNNLNPFEVKIAWLGDTRCVIIDENYEILFETEDHKVATNENERRRIVLAAKVSEVRPGLVNNVQFNKEAAEAERQGKTFRRKSYIGKRTLPSGEEAGDLCLFSYTNGISLQVSRSLGDPLAARSAICEPEIVTLSFPHAKQLPDRNSDEGSSENVAVGSNRNDKIRFVLASDGLWDVLSSEQVAKYIEDMDRKNQKIKKAKKKVSLSKAAENLSIIAKRARERQHLSKDDITCMIVEIPTRVQQ